jgi:Ca2+/Na+ antiporter
MGIELIRILRKKTGFKPKAIPVAISIITIGGYFAYNMYLRSQYGSIFLGNIMPPDDFNHIIELFKIVYKDWFYLYFSNIHYIILLLLFIIALVFKFIYKRKEYINTLSTIGLIFIGGICYGFIMMYQFKMHDYYFLDTFFLSIVLFLLFFVSLMPNTKTLQILMVALILIMGPMFIYKGVKAQEIRRETGSWDKSQSIIKDYKGAKELLNSVGANQESRILVMPAYNPNLPFIFMDKKGYVLMSPKVENIKPKLKWDYDFIVAQNDCFISDVYSVYPEILTQIVKIADNNKISIYKYSDEKKNQTLVEFLELNKKENVVDKIMTYDTTFEDNWQHTEFSYEVSYSGLKSGVLNPESEYGLTYKSKSLDVLKDESMTMLFSSYFLKSELNNCDIVVTIVEEGELTYYKTYNLKKLLLKKGEWEELNLVFQLPKVNKSDYEFSLYVHNTGNNKLYIDDFSFKLFK